MKQLYEVLMQHEAGGKYWRVDVLAYSHADAAIRASARMRREHGITDCTWTVQGITCIGEATASARPSKSWTTREMARLHGDRA